MYPWDVLGIEPCEDRKLIKQAYAGLLKKHRPDEDPEGFQAIHEAYQTALNRLKQQAQNTQPAGHRPDWSTPERTSDQPVVPDDVELKPVTHDGLNNESEGIELPVSHTSNRGSDQDEIDLLHPNPEVTPLTEQQPEPVDYRSADTTEPDEEQQRQQELVENLFNQLHAMAFAPIQVKSELDNWQFLQLHEELQDFQLRDQVAREMFRRVAEYNLFQRRETGFDLIPPEVLHHMAGLFNWEANWLDYSNHFPEHYLRCVFTELEKPVDRIRSAYKVGYVKRLLALVVDFVAYFLLLGMLASLIETLPVDGVLYFYLGFAGFRLAMELLMSNRSSFATNYFGYRFLDQFLNRPSRMVVLKRFVALELMLIPVYLIIAGLFAVDTAIIILGVYAFSLMLLMYFCNDRLPHDLLSGTVAVKKA
jgi:hypothetical protein